MPLVEALKHYDRHRRRRFHVPAHAGQNLLGPDFNLLAAPFRYDLTELDGLDVLSEPSGCIQEAQAQAAELFGVARSYFLVNGASVGLMAAMLSVVQPGQKVLLPRNAHRSVLSGLILAGAEPIWFLPERLTDWGLWGPVSVTRVRDLLNAHPDLRALFLTSPTYEGLGSDVQVLAALCRDRGVKIVVDEAHGSLWPLSDDLPVSACQIPCDVVIHSLHKSGGSLTQGAIAHLPHGSCVDPAVFQQALNTLQTTSPSYLLMASLDAACGFLASDAGQERVSSLLKMVSDLRARLSTDLSQFRLFQPNAAGISHWDPCKLYLTHPGLSGEEWGGYVEESCQLAYESASPYGVLYMAGLGLEEADFEAFHQTFVVLDSASRKNDPRFDDWRIESEAEDPSLLVPQTVLSPREAFFAPGGRVSPADAVGRTAKETVVHCPPGIPVLMPGERILPAHVPLLPEQGVLVVS